MPFSTSSMAHAVEDINQIKEQLATKSPADNTCLPYKEMRTLKALLKDIGEHFGIKNLEQETDLEIILETILHNLTSKACFTTENPNTINLSLGSQNGN